MIFKKNRKRDLKKDYPYALMDSANARSGFAEAYRTLRTNLHFSSTDKRIQSVMITSAGQSEGKTITAYNLGHTVSQSGKSVLLIDADLRKPTLSRLFQGADTGSGLTSLLSDVFNTDIQEGRLETVSTMDLLRLIQLQNRTGILQVGDGQDSVQIHFLKGRAVDITWLTRPEEKMFINTLIRNGNLSAENARVVLQGQKSTGLKSGLMLVNLGLLPEETIKGLLNIHLMESFQVFSKMRAGRFQFENRPESQFSAPKPGSFDVVESVFSQFLEADDALPYLQSRVEEAIVHTDSDNLSVLPCGTIPPNPSELLGSERFTFLLDLLKTRFDFLIVDTPPILAASDGLLIAPQADGVLLVVKSGMLKRDMVVKAREQLHRSRANLLGVVLNAIDVKKNGYYSYYKYYTSYYGETESDPIRP